MVSPAPTGAGAAANGPGGLVYPCVFPPEQGNDRRDGPQPDSPDNRGEAPQAGHQARADGHPAGPTRTAPGENPSQMPRSQRVMLLGVGYASLALAVLGALLPLMPTTVFLLIAAWAFGRASPTLRERLRNNPRFGRTLREWEEHRAISPPAKRAAVLAMALSWLVVTLAFRSLPASAIAGACMAGVALYILTRPSRAG